MFRIFSRNYVCVSAFRFLNQATETKPSTPTIFALSSGQGRCGIAVIRVSGKEASMSLLKMTDITLLPKPRYSHFKDICHPITKDVLDKGLVFWYPAPNSFTGEDVVEFQIHGGIATISALLHALSCIPNYRMAQPGEFTRRSYYNNKMDLLEVEGLSDLINSETEWQRKQALLQMCGGLSHLYNGWKEEILSALSYFETLFNFEVTSDVDSEAAVDDVRARVYLVYEKIAKHLTDDRCGEILRSGVHVVIIGEPNVGKSTLYNWLCEKEVAIVSPYPGTTRDVLSISMDVGGYAMTMSDTCGIRTEDGLNPVEVEGIRRAKKAVDTADLIILMVDITKFMAWKAKDENKTVPLTTFLAQYLAEMKLEYLTSPDEQLVSQLFLKPCILVFNKYDKLDNPISEMLLEGGIAVSLTNNTGGDHFRKELSTQIKSLCGTPNSRCPVITSVRQRASMELCCHFLRKFIDSEEALAEGGSRDYAILGNHLREALKVVTEVVVGKKESEPVNDEVLDEIFGNFCIGK